MNEISLWLAMLGAAWLAGTISGVAGFGGALLLLPALSLLVGAKAAVPILTVAQLLGNLSRAAFGFREIRWRPVALFCLGAVPLSLFGAHLFVALPAAWLLRGVGAALLLFVALRHTPLGQKRVPEWAFVPLGALVGLLSALAGSAGPLGAAIFLSLQLPPTAYIASEAVTAAAMHFSKSLVYGRYALLSPEQWGQGFLLGGALTLGAWSGRAWLKKIPKDRFAVGVEILLVISAFSLIFNL